MLKSHLVSQVDKLSNDGKGSSLGKDEHRDSLYDYATCNLSFTSHFSSFELWSFDLGHSELGILFSGIPTITTEASVAVCQLCQLVSARVLE